jgi:hypothetical protein
MRRLDGVDDEALLGWLPRKLVRIPVGIELLGYRDGAVRVA